MSTPRGTTIPIDLSTITEMMNQLSLRSTPSGTNITDRGLFRLPPELRNVVYEYVLADVHNNVCIDLGAGLNKVYRVEDRKSKPASEDKHASRLSMLLACRQINHEASGVAYSKMGMSFETVSVDPKAFEPHQGVNAYIKASERLKIMLQNFAETFDASKSSLLTSVVFHDSQLMSRLAGFNNCMMGDTLLTKKCTSRCESFSLFQGLFHETFHHVRFITVHVTKDKMETLYKALTKGAPWLSVTLEPFHVDELLAAFPSLQQIIVRRACGEQVCDVIDGGIFAAESRMPLRGMDEWQHNI